MTGQVLVFQPVDGEAGRLREVFVAEPTWLPHGDRTAEDRWRMTLHGGGMSRPVQARIGPPAERGQAVWRPLVWEPELDDATARLSARLLPSLEGELGLYLSGTATSLVLDGRYQPPGGRVGEALDDLALRRVARGTATRLLADIALTLSARAADRDRRDPRMPDSDDQED